MMDRLRRNTVIDLGACVGILVVALPPALDSNVNDPGATVAGPLLLPAFLLAILWRRRTPLGAAWMFGAACIVSGVPTFHQFRLLAAIAAALLVLYPLATRYARAQAITGLVVVVAGLAFVGATESVVHGAVGAFNMLGYSLPLCLAVWGAGRIVRSRERLANELRDRSGQLRRQREATAELAVEVDRARLASDLDLAMRSRLQEMIDLASLDDADPTAGRARFGRIELLGRESLDEMRALLGLLRSVDPGARAPRPTLEQLDALLAEARAGGRVVDLEIEGERRPLAAAIELAAYRTVQHALVAVGAGTEQSAKVHVRYLPDRLELEIGGARRDGSAAAAAMTAARERVTSFGGRFSAEAPTPETRVLHAQLPLAPAYA
jgi:signal transduction histidine kinase